MKKMQFERGFECGPYLDNFQALLTQLDVQVFTGSLMRICHNKVYKSLSINNDCLRNGIKAQNKSKIQNWIFAGNNISHHKGIPLL